MNTFTVLLFTTLLVINTSAVDIPLNYGLPPYSIGHYRLEFVNGQWIFRVSGHDNKILSERGEGDVNFDGQQVLGAGKLDTGAGVKGTGDVAAGQHEFSTGVTGDFLHGLAATAAGVGERDAREINRAGQVPVVGPRTRGVRPRRAYRRHQW